MDSLTISLQKEKFKSMNIPHPYISFKMTLKGEIFDGDRKLESRIVQEHTYKLGYNTYYGRTVQDTDSKYLIFHDSGYLKIVEPCYE